MRGWKNGFYANSNQKRTGMAILTSDKIDFKAKTYLNQKITRDKEGHCMLMKVAYSKKVQQLQTVMHIIYRPSKNLK